MKAVLISIQPKWCELIANGKKTVEVRKTKPKLETPFKCYIYQTRKTWVYDIYSRIADWQGKVIGEFVCDTIIADKTFGHDALFNAMSCMSVAEIASYCVKNPMYGWHISDLVIYDKPKELREFHLPCIPECDGLCEYGCLRPLKRTPQSWCYVERLGEG
ncbi:MAG: ASCH domain-containing protein [Clostridia bacterium]|nr:ASCH domain-containing protein [Clostridia bacterium]